MFGVARARRCGEAVAGEWCSELRVRGGAMGANRVIGWTTRCALRMVCAVAVCGLGVGGVGHPTIGRQWVSRRPVPVRAGAWN